MSKHLHRSTGFGGIFRNFPIDLKTLSHHSRLLHVDIQHLQLGEMLGLLYVMFCPFSQAFFITILPLFTLDAVFLWKKYNVCHRYIVIITFCFK